MLLYDSDHAGLRATFRAGDELLRSGVRVRVATLPEGEDPDSLVRGGGATALAPLLKDAMDILERKIQLLDRRGWFEGVEHRRDALDKLLPTLRATADPITRDLYIGAVAERVGVSREVLEAELRARPAPVTSTSPTAPPPRPPRPEDTPRRRSVPGAQNEATLLRAICADPTWLERARGRIPPERFEVPAYRAIYAALLEAERSSPLAGVAERLAPEYRDAWGRLMESSEKAEGYHWDAEFAGAAQALDERALLREIADIRDPAERTRRFQELSAHARARRWYKKPAEQARRPTRARDERADSPQED